MNVTDAQLRAFGLMCLFDHDEPAAGIYAFPGGGCACFPTHAIQMLCAQHAVKSEALGDMIDITREWLSLDWDGDCEVGG